MSKRLKCPKCKKLFKEKWRYEKHLETVDCTKTYTCEKCNASYKRKDYLASHNKRNPNCDEAIKTSKSDFTCGCGKSFSTNGNLAKHKQKCVKKDDKSELTEMKEMMREIMKNNKELRDEVAELKNNKNGVTYITNNDNRSINMYANITIVGNGNENLETIAPSTVRVGILKDRDRYVPDMVKRIHADPKLPENHNVYYDPQSESTMVYVDDGKAKKWISQPLDVTAKQLTKKSIRYLTSYEMYKGLTSGTKTYMDLHKNIEYIVHDKKWDSSEDIEKIKEILSEVLKYEGFKENVEFQRNQTPNTPMIEVIEEQEEPLQSTKTINFINKDNIEIYDDEFDFLEETQPRKWVTN